MGGKTIVEPEIISYLKTSFVKPNLPSRDFEEEKFQILKAKVELKLLTTLGTSAIKEWLPEGRQVGNLYHVQQFAIVTKTHDERVKSNLNLKAIGKERQRHVLAMEKLIKLIKTPTNFSTNNFQSERQGLQRLAWELHLQAGLLSDWEKQPIQRTIGEIIPRDSNTYTPLVSLFCKVNAINEYSAVNILAKKFHITDDILVDVELDKRTSWRLKEVSNQILHIPYQIIYTFYDTNNILAYHILFTSIHNPIEPLKKKDVLLPISTWVKPGEMASFQLGLPIPGRKLPYNANLLAQYPELPVILTSSLEVARINMFDNLGNLKANLQYIWLSWYNPCLGSESEVEWELLKNPNRIRKVYYFLDYMDHHTLRESFETAIAVYQQFKKIKEIDLKFIFYKGELNAGVSPFILNGRTITLNEVPHNYDLKLEPINGFIELLKSYGFHDLAEELAPKMRKKISLQSVSDILPQRESSINFILSPVIKDREVTLLSGEAELVHLLGVNIAYSVSVGASTLKDWQPGDSNISVIYLNAHDQSTLKHNLDLAIKMYGLTNAHESDVEISEQRFSSTSFGRSTLNLTDESGREMVYDLLDDLSYTNEKQTKTLLVLDGYVTIDDLSTKRESLKEFFDSLANMKASVLIIPRVAGDACESKVNLNKLAVDTYIEIHAEEPSSPSKLACSITVQNNSSEPSNPFKAEIAPKARKPKWQLVKQTRNKGQLKKEIVELRKRNWSIEEMADYLGYAVPSLKGLIRTMDIETRVYVKSKDLIALYDKGQNYKDIAKELKLTEGEIKKRTKRILTGEYLARFTDEGLSIDKLSKKFGVSIQFIEQLIESFLES